MVKRANNFINIAGLKFGKLFVVSLEEVKNKEPIWKCLCECGNFCSKRGANLKNGGTTSCGCHSLEIKRIKKGESGFNKLLSEYKAGAIKRKLSFTISDKEFRKITKENCHYCKIEPKQESIVSNPRSTNEGKEYSKYIYNGIDRKDNSLGYDKGNCLPCCFLCNKAKNTMSYKEFIDYIGRFK